MESDGDVDKPVAEHIKAEASHFFIILEVGRRVKAETRRKTEDSPKTARD